MSGVAIDEGGRDRSQFRPDIEGLRAVAVLLVLFFHADLPFFGGGFVGVDVFFVVSGFLITGLIVRELRDTGAVALPTFYARRARRLLPAAALVIVVTLLASAILLPPLRLPDVARDAAASALYVPNIRFAVQATDYLQAEFDPSPLLHYWSLGVEEQFYLFWPALLLITASLAGRTRRTGAIAAVVVGVGVISVALSLALTQENAPFGFFLLPARAWELALGGLVFLGAERLARLGSRTRGARGRRRTGPDRRSRGADRHDYPVSGHRRTRPDDRRGARHRRRPATSARRAVKAPRCAAGALDRADLVLALSLALADPPPAGGCRRP